MGKPSARLCPPVRALRQAKIKMGIQTEGGGEAEEAPRTDDNVLLVPGRVQFSDAATPVESGESAPHDQGEAVFVREAAVRILERCFFVQSGDGKARVDPAELSGPGDCGSDSNDAVVGVIDGSLSAGGGSEPASEIPVDVELHVVENFKALLKSSDWRAASAGTLDEVAPLTVEIQREAYALGIKEDLRGSAPRWRVRLRAISCKGLFWGLQTFAQLATTNPDRVRSEPRTRSANKLPRCNPPVWRSLPHGHANVAPLARLPEVHVADWPEFAARGFMLDVSRSRVPKMEALKELIELLAYFKSNQFQLYIEHTFAYSNHGEVWQGQSPFTASEIREIDAFCRSRFVELVPNQNSLGHMHQWLKHSTYHPLAEVPEGVSHPFSLDKEPFSLSPTSTQTEELIDELFHELLPCFTSRMFNVGLDEAFDLGQGRSAEAARQAVRDGLSSNGKGTDVLYIDYLLKLHQKLQHFKLVEDDDAETSFTVQFWADLLLLFGKKDDTNARRLLGKVPKDGSCIALLWGYEADSPLDAECEILSRSGIPFYVCPGTSSWCSITGRTDNVVANIERAAAAAVKHGAVGMLNTDWGDCGHLQPIEISYMGAMLGASHAWNHAPSPNVEDASERVPQLLDSHVFGVCHHEASASRGRGIGRYVYDIGNIYLELGRVFPNSTAVWWPMYFSCGLHESTAVEAGARLLAGETGSRLLHTFGWAAMRMVSRLFGFDETLLRAAIDKVEHMSFRALRAHGCRHCLGGHTLDCWQWSATLLQFACEITFQRQRIGLHRPISDLPDDVRSQLGSSLRDLLHDHKTSIRPAHSRAGGLHESHRALAEVLASLASGASSSEQPGADASACLVSDDDDDDDDDDDGLEK